MQADKYEQRDHNARGEQQRQCTEQASEGGGSRGIGALQRRSPDEPEGKQNQACADATGCWTVERNDDRREQG
ncbi:MAG: hypothetical protein U0841_24415 [Chloroflexia bacterium]